MNLHIKSNSVSSVEIFFLINQPGYVNYNFYLHYSSDTKNRHTEKVGPRILKRNPNVAP